MHLRRMETTDTFLDEQTLINDISFITEEVLCDFKKHRTIPHRLHSNGGLTAYGFYINVSCNAHIRGDRLHLRRN